MCYIYQTPSSSSSKQALQCPPTPKQYRGASMGNPMADPMFFPSSSSILGSSTCVTESTCDTSVDSLLHPINELPVTVLVLKPKYKSQGEARTSRRRKLSMSDLNGDVPPLPYVTLSKKPMNRSTSDPYQTSKQNGSGVSLKMNAAPMPRMSIRNLPGSRRLSMNAKCA